MAKLFEKGKEDIAYLSDIGSTATIPPGASLGNIPLFGAGGVLQDSGKALSDFAAKSDIAPAVDAAASGILDAIRNEYAVAGYVAMAWTAGQEYAQGDFCSLLGAGYRCLVANSDSSFDASKWELVLSAAGRSRIDSLLSQYDKEGLAALRDIAPEYSGTDTYVVDDLVAKDGVLQICTRGGRGPAATFAAGATVVAYVNKKIGALSDALSDHIDDADVHVSQTDRSDWNGKLDNTSIAGTTIGDSSNGWRVHVQGVGPGGDNIHRTWEFTRSSTSPNADTVARLGDIPESITVDKTLSIEGEAADAKAVGDALRVKAGIANLPYEVRHVSASESDEPDTVVFRLFDRTVNVMSETIPDGNTILLFPPSESGESGRHLARDFYVVITVSAGEDVTMSLDGATLKDYEGGTPALMAVAGKTVVYRFTECATEGRNFIVTCLADPAYRYVKEIERALDDVLEMAGYIPGVEKGVFVPEQDDPTVVHRLVVVPDDATGEATLKVDQDATGT